MTAANLSPASPQESIPLQPIAVPDPDIARLRRFSRRLEGILAFVVLALAFLLASFAVRNSDFWLHMASGRLIAAGDWNWGHDPFNHTTADVYCVNHSWLYDWLLFQLQRGLGDAVLVVLKAASVAVLAAVMMACRRRGEGLWLPALCTALAVLVMSPRLLFQPVLFSYVALALTLLVLLNAQEKPRALWLLPPLFALWVNTDAWFLLGPLTVALFLLANLTAGAAARRLGLVLIVGLAACLVNPHHVRAFQLPMEVSPAVLSAGWTHDVRFRGIFESPWRLSRYSTTSAGLNAAGLAYFVLLGLGVISFLANKAGRHDWRLPVWLVFAVLGSWQLRTVPFFAVVGGPITALNLQQALARRVSPNLSHWEYALRLGNLGRSFSILAGMAMLALAWPGWLHAFPHDLQHVQWSVQPNPSLDYTARSLKGLSEQGQLPPAARLFVSHPDLGPYLAWHWPTARGYVDTRLGLFSQLADEYLTVSRVANPALSREVENLDPASALRAVDQRHVDLILLYDPELTRSVAPLGGSLADGSTPWSLILIGGKTLVFRRDTQSPADGGAHQLRRLDLDRLAFGGPAGDGTSGLRSELPGSTLPSTTTWWQRYLKPPLPRSWESDAAAAYVRLFEEQSHRQERARAQARLSAHIAGWILCGGGLVPIPTTSQLAARIVQGDLYLPNLDEGPASAALLAVQHARRALTANPNDATAWLRLGQAYVHLRWETRERQWAGPFVLLDVLRHVQIVTALENALRIEPTLAPAHRTLADMYLRRNYLDAALEHRRAEARLTREAGAASLESTDEFDRRVKNLEGIVTDMERAVTELHNQFVIQSDTVKNNSLAQARLAVQMGLARKALDEILLQSDLRLFGIEGARLELELLLMLGRPERVRQELADEEMAANRDRLGTYVVPLPKLAGYPQALTLPAFDWFNFLLAAGCGDQATAQDTVLGMESAARSPVSSFDLTRQILVAVAGEVGAGTRASLFDYRAIMRDTQVATGRIRADTTQFMLLRSDVQTLAALLALEAGQPAIAIGKLNQVVKTSMSSVTDGSPASLPIADYYRERIDTARRTLARE